MEKSQPTFIVGIGGSAGALNAYKQLLGALPTNTGMAFVIISHMNPAASSALAQILARHTAMEVTVASAAMRILRNNVYVIPPDTDLLIADYTFQVVSPRATGYTQVDVFLTSLAEAMQTRGVGIILSGYGRDGTDGCKNLKAKGGTTFAQDISAEVDIMPRSAQSAGWIDFVGSPERIAYELEKLARGSGNL